MATGRNLGGMFRKLGRDVLLNTIAASRLLNSPMRVPIMRAVGMTIDPTVILHEGFWVSSRQLEIGPGSKINVQAFFDATAPITIGSNVNFGPQVMIHTSAHDIGGVDRRCGTQRALPVTIGDSVWIGLRATVLAGVTIGEGCVIAAGAVVTRDCEPNGLYAGVPARRMRDL